MCISRFIKQNICIYISQSVPYIYIVPEARRIQAKKNLDHTAKQITVCRLKDRNTATQNKTSKLILLRLVLLGLVIACP